MLACVCVVSIREFLGMLQIDTHALECVHLKGTWHSLQMCIFQIFLDNGELFSKAIVPVDAPTDSVPEVPMLYILINTWHY